jgi:hypothetical protein
MNEELFDGTLAAIAISFCLAASTDWTRGRVPRPIRSRSRTTRPSRRADRIELARSARPCRVSVSRKSPSEVPFCGVSAVM